MKSAVLPGKHREEKIKMLGDYKIGAFSRPVSDLADVPNISAGELKRHFDSNSYELLNSLNAVIDYLTADDALNNLKCGGKEFKDILNELKLLAANEAVKRENGDDLKVDKEAGKALSANDFTDALKEKLENLSNYDDTLIRTLISTETAQRALADNLKVDKETGKGLSANDFTNADKNKLESLSNYDDTEVRGFIENKVDKEDGKGLSEENFTNDLLLKLTSLPESVYSKTETNALIIPTINYTDLDNTYTEGIYRVKKAGYTGTPDEQNSYTVYKDEYFLLIVHQDEYFYHGMPNETDTYQMILSKSGVPKTRISYVQGDWSAWQDYIPAISITQQSAIQSVSSTVTTYTFNPKSYVSPSAAFKINHTGTNTVTFNFAAPSNTGYTNEILVYFKTALDNAVVWGSNVKFTDDEIPTIEAGVYYRIVAEYNPIMSKWVVGIINDGKGA